MPSKLLVQSNSKITEAQLRSHLLAIPTVGWWLAMGSPEWLPDGPVLSNSSTAGSSAIRSSSNCVCASASRDSLLYCNCCIASTQSYPAAVPPSAVVLACCPPAFWSRRHPARQHGSSVRVLVDNHGACCRLSILAPNLRNLR